MEVKEDCVNCNMGTMRVYSDALYGWLKYCPTCGYVVSELGGQHE